MPASRGSRWRARWPAEAADRLFLLGLSLIALKLAHFGWLPNPADGRTLLLLDNALQFLAFLCCLALLWLSLRSRLPGWLLRLRPGRVAALAPLALVVVGVVVGVAVARSEPPSPTRIDDANALAVCGARAIEAGRNPYWVKEINCLTELGLPVTLATPFRSGPLAGRYTYPRPSQIEAAVKSSRAHGGTQTQFAGLGKGPFELITMLPVANAPSWVRSLWCLLAVSLFSLVLAACSRRLWPATLALFWASYFIPGSAVNFAAAGNGEAFSYLLMALAVLLLRRPFLSGFALGLAAGSNELALFFLPAYALLTLGRPGARSRLAGFVLSLLIGTLPWVLRYPDALQVIWHNMTAPTFPLGFGPSVLVLEQVLRPPSPLLFFVAAALAMLLSLLVGLTRPSWRVAGAVLMLAGLWLSWRSLDEYLAQLPLLALAAMVGVMLSQDRHREELAGAASAARVPPPSLAASPQGAAPS